MRDMLRHAYYWRWADPELLDLPVGRYVERWGRPGDTALVVIDRFQPVGAAWYRLFKGAEPGYAAAAVRSATITLAPPRSAIVSNPCRLYRCTAGLSGMTLRLICS